MAGRTGPAKTSVDSEQSAGNERYLDSVLRRLYPFQRGEPTTHISLDPSDIAMCAALAEQLSPSMGSASERLAPVLHLRPVSNAEYSNVLGVVWNKVKQMAVPDYLFVTEVAVGILPRNQITGSAHYGPNAELAVVLHLGLFRRLYSLNLTMLRILAAHSASDAAQLRKLLGRLRIGVLPDHSGLDPEEPLYKSEKDFRVVDAISKIQQEFVVLHELGHIHGWLAESSRAAGRDSSAASEEGEFSADDWAFGLVLRRGGKFHRLDLYIRALLWLFEYWRAISPGVASLGRRWHRIVAAAERSGLRLPPSEVGITQQLFDSAFERGSP